MTDFDKRKRIDEFFFDFEKVEKIFDRLLDKMVSEQQAMPQGKPIIMGFSMRFGPDGAPIIENFGNAKIIQGRPELAKQREPLVDVVEGKKDFTITAEVPGAEEKDLLLHAEKDSLTVSIKNPDRQFFKKIDFQQPINPMSLKKSLKNGILEITVKKK